MFRMAGEAGLRRGEILGLRWPDLDLAARRVTLASAVWQEAGRKGAPPRRIANAPKGGRSRRVAISQTLATHLGDWYAESVGTPPAALPPETGVEPMPAGSSPKRERQYEHIRDSAKKRGASTKRAKEIAARTVNKERARSGEAKTSSPTSTKDMSSGRRGGQRSGTNRPKGRTREQLYAEAKKLNVEGRSKMNKEQLRRAVDAKK